MEKLPLSISLIARNEAANLPRCLSAVVDWAAEMVVVINDCQDETASLARTWGARVEEHPWVDFTTQKNYSLGLCRQPWVLCLDADEVVSPPLAQAIRNFLRDPGPHQGACFPRLSFFLGRWIRHGDWYPDYSLRLARREKCVWKGAKIHEHLAVEGPVARLAGDLWHFSYPDMQSCLRKTMTYGEAFAQREYARGGTRFHPAEACFRSAWRFLRGYFCKGGFLDGFPGLFIAAMNAYATFYKYAKIYELNLPPEGRAHPCPPSASFPE